MKQQAESKKYKISRVKMELVVNVSEMVFTPIIRGLCDD
jgi:hypothetical protein